MNGKQSFADVVKDTLAELGPHVVPWTPLFPEEEENQEIEEPEDRKKPELPDDAVQVLGLIIRRFDQTITERCETLDLDRGQELRARRILDQHGYVTLATKLGKQELFGPTEKGIEWGKARNIPVEEFKSGAGHEAICRRLERSIPEEWEVAIDRHGQFNGRQPDRLVKFLDGTRIAVQACVTNTASNEIEAALDLAAVETVDGVLLVAATKAKAGRINKLLKVQVRGSEGSELFDQNAQARGVRKIRITDAATVLGRGFDWNSLVQGLRGTEQQQ